MGGKLGIGMGHAVNLSFDEMLVEWVKEDFLFSSTLLSNSDGAASDARWAHDIIEDSGVHSSKSSGSWSLLGMLG